MIYKLLKFLLNNNLENVSTFENRVGLINAYEDKAHAAGISFSGANNKSFPIIIIDDDKYYLTPFNGWNGHNAKILRTELDNSNQVWRMKYTLYIDGVEYVEYINFD